MGTAAEVAGKLLRVYVQDHHAAAAAGLNLVRRMARENASAPFADELTRLADEIANDRTKLGAVLRALDVEPSRLKIGVARAAERVSRLKLNGRLLGYSPLSRLIELETLGAGILAKRGLWNALAQATDVPRAGLDFDELVDRANAQLAVVEQLRERAAAIAFPSARD